MQIKGGSWEKQQDGRGLGDGHANKGGSQDKL